MRFAELEAATVDGYGTLLRLADPVPALQAALACRGVDRSPAEIAAAFRAEVDHYRPRSHEGRDEDSLAALRLDCCGVFLGALGNSVDSDAFVGAFVAALVFEPIEGVAETLRELQARGLHLGVVANWDCALPEHLEAAGLLDRFDTVVTSARAGVAKPDPAIFELALRELGVPPERAVHVGDEPLDEEGARAAGMAFVPAPLATAFEGWT
ncbi:MAG TPA: HAD-IA family hydrolase [Gaiellaceae bacterium]|nr:HAD-IA family hydrolase [Gaiellaceae bacterium]